MTFKVDTVRQYVNMSIPAKNAEARIAEDYRLYEPVQFRNINHRAGWHGIEIFDVNGRMVDKES